MALGCEGQDLGTGGHREGCAGSRPGAGPGRRPQARLGPEAGCLHAHHGPDSSASPYRQAGFGSRRMTADSFNGHPVPPAGPQVQCVSRRAGTELRWPQWRRVSGPEPAVSVCRGFVTLSAADSGSTCRLPTQKSICSPSPINRRAESAFPGTCGFGPGAVQPTAWVFQLAVAEVCLL